MIKIKLESLIEKAGINARRLHLDTHIRYNTISDMLINDVKQIPLENLDILCEYFNCNVSDIIEYVSTNEDTISIKHYIQKASAGLGYDLNDDDLWEIIKVPTNYESEKADFVVTIEGDSMEPDFHNGDNVLVEATDTIDENEIGIFVVDGRGYIKKLGRNKLISLNPKYDDISLLNTINKCCGRVLGIIQIV